MLHHRGTGGLQVLPPGTTKWQYIKPLPGLAVCNVGDTLCPYTSSLSRQTNLLTMATSAVYSGGIFKSNIHRVVPPPPPQDAFTRYSFVSLLPRRRRVAHLLHRRQLRLLYPTLLRRHSHTSLGPLTQDCRSSSRESSIEQDGERRHRWRLVQTQSYEPTCGEQERTGELGR